MTSKPFNSITMMLRGDLPVEWQKLGNCAEISMGQSPPGSTYNGNQDGVPFIQGCAEFQQKHPSPKKYTSSNQYKESIKGDILFSVRAPVGKINRNNLKRLAIGRGIAAIRGKSNVSTDYLMHYLLNIQTTLDSKASGSTFKSISGQKLKEIVIPLPPLEIQQAIADTLDKFTQLEAELEAELEARRIQQQEYLARLLLPQDDWQAFSLGDIADIFDGPHATPQKTDSGPWYLSISSLVDGHFDLSMSAHMSNNDFPKWTKRVKPQLGDTMFSYETRIGQAAFWDRSEPAALGRRMGILRPKTSEVTPKFLTLIYLGPEFQSFIKSKVVRGSNIERFPIAKMSAWPISLPPIAKQEAIIIKADKFKTIVSDISSGIPAEIAARRQQYEYYRKKLLTFPQEEAK